MIKCASCLREIVDDSRVCSYCGAAVKVPGGGATLTAPPKVAPMPSAHAEPGSSSDSIDQARFTPGTMLTERYRIVGLLGKGGMGEVYRADDLTLRQPVALKFLPEALANNPRRLERFHHEVRVARQVSHPNVCRVYDIGETDGHPFISMEFIDGEDLASVLRRMGRPSKDKALQIARQLCAGLAAAHDKGVLHRDLKPHNVMVDGRGRVRITDFGLAGFTEEFTRGQVRAGTPAYMAPEQLAGREVSVKSDLYALGLVLFELFTGQRAFEGTTREPLDGSRSALTPTSLSGLVDDIDPAVERVVLRCLEHEPSARPSSALAVAAALPGGDPLAAALEAGETPDPAMVAAAGGVGGMRPVVAVTCLVGVLAGMVTSVLLSNPLYRQVPFEKPPQALADRAGEIIKKLGHTDPVNDQAYAFARDWDYLTHVEENDLSSTRWDRLAKLQPPAIYFWYRQSPRPLIPRSDHWNVSLNEPPTTISGMANVTLDPLGRLIQLNVVPPQRDDVTTDAGAEPSPTDWSLLFAEAQLDMDGFTPTKPVWTPSMFCDERAAWKGHYPDQPDVSLRIEAGGYRGTPTFFKIIGPWTKADRMEEDPTPVGIRVGVIVVLFLFIVLLLASVLIARRNLRLRRGDRTGANRLALFFVAAMLLNWALSSTHVADLSAEFQRAIVATGMTLFVSGWAWLLYIALEPYVRRRWPQTLISWSRLLSGRLRDPLVGRDILIGAVFAAAAYLVEQLGQLAVGWLGAPPPIPGQGGLSRLLGGRYLMGQLLNPGFILFPLIVLFFLFVLRIVLRKQWLAAVAFVLLFVVLAALSPPSGYQGAAIGVHLLAIGSVMAMLLVVLLRFGLLALVVMSFFGTVTFDSPIPLDFSSWYVGASLLCLAVAAAVAGYGFHTALAGRPLFRDELLET